MLYITGLFALNLECSLGTTGDWHMSGMDWSKLTLADSNNSIFGTYGIERNSTRLVPERHITLPITYAHVLILLNKKTIALPKVCTEIS